MSTKRLILLSWIPIIGILYHIRYSIKVNVFDEPVFYSIFNILYHSISIGGVCWALQILLR